jgi:hypothetical protein
MVRWWDGVTWSDVATPAGPGVAVGAMPGLPGVSTAEPLDTSGPEQPDRADRTPWVIGLTLLVVAVVVATGVLVGTSGSPRTPAAEATSSSSVLPLPQPPSFPPGTVLIVDDAAGISYPHLGNGWYEYDLTQKRETTSTAGQYFVTQDDPPSGGIYLAECTSGPIAESFGWTGPQSLRDTALAIAASERANYYPAPNDQRVLRDEPRTVDGHAAHLFEFQLSWDVSGYEATGERATVLLVDVGRRVPALLFVSIPNTHAELYGVVDRVIEGVRVIG